MNLPVEKQALHVPELQELAEVLQDGLQSHFESIAVSVVDCPDMTQKPFTLAAPGLCGSPRLVDVGGVPNIHPLPRFEKIYDLEKLAELAELPGAFMIGAGAGPFKHVGVNSELMPNLVAASSTKEQINCTHNMKIDVNDGTPVLEKCSSTECALMVNLLCSEGKPGKVLEVKASKRTSEKDFVAAMREVLKARYGDKPVGLGGSFLIEKGKAWLHIMPDFCKSPITSIKENEAWLKFYDFDAPIICLSVFYSTDPGLDLRIEHTHCFSHHGVGGHYHYDTTPDDVVYRGYFIPAESVYRVDRPEEQWIPTDK
ncbi:ester hydrolase C11orf54 homolog [Asterias amurensis]|uniref:ester hydrolase C11orf54 homolog n=1 Tax=Asterias amurensis TaxID=7602 RepID=UPI003AB66A06